MYHLQYTRLLWENIFHLPTLSYAGTHFKDAPLSISLLMAPSHVTIPFGTSETMLNSKRDLVKGTTCGHNHHTNTLCP